MLASIAGAHVITFYEAFVDADILYIITEFATHGDLLGYLKNAKRKGQVPEATVWSLFIQMCLGVQSLHDKNILHRDLKAANVFMFSNSYLKLGDFGVSKVLKTGEALARTQPHVQPIITSEFLVGRGQDCKFRVSKSNTWVSNRHFMIGRDTMRQIYVRDMSSNGTKVRARRTAALPPAVLPMQLRGARVPARRSAAPPPAV